MSFFLVENKDLAVAQIPKCGINSIREWLGRSIVVVKNNDPRLLKISRRVAFIRHPIERLKSVYSFFYWLNEDGRKHSCNAPVDNWESFIDYVLNPDITDDKHWLSQIIHVGSVPNIFHRFEDIASKYEIYKPGLLPHNNKASRRLTTDYRLSDLISKYVDDLNLWRELF